MDQKKLQELLQRQQAKLDKAYTETLKSSGYVAAIKAAGDVMRETLRLMAADYPEKGFDVSTSVKVEGRMEGGVNGVPKLDFYPLDEAGKLFLRWVGLQTRRGA